MSREAIEDQWVATSLQVILKAVITSISLVSPLSAQVIPSNIVPDTSLGTESSQVSSGDQVEQITGGAERGQNLFHSFREFNVGTGRGAYFLVPNDSIQNVLARVTGRNVSEILGTLGTFRLSNGQVQRSPANLFLVNPNGIVFGEAASLDLGGSFFATTANAVKLGESGLFSTSEPALDNLLTVSPSAFLFNTIVAQNLPEIQVRSTAANVLGGNGLQVSDGKTLLLLGGNVSVSGGQVNAWGGQVEIGAVKGAGAINLSQGSLSLPTEINQAKTEFTQGAQVDVRSGNGGSIRVFAHDIQIAEKSQLLAGIFSGLGSAERLAGDIILSAKEGIMIQNSLVANDVYSQAFGKSGNIVINARKLEIFDNGQVRSQIAGTGTAKDIIIQASEVDIFETFRSDSSGTGIFNQIIGKGSAGKIIIEADRFRLRDGTQITANTFGEGISGSIFLKVRDFTEITGASSRRPTFLVADVYAGSTGQGGNLRIETNHLSIRDGAQVATSTFSSTNAGTITVNAARVEVVGQSQFSFSGLFSQSEPGSSGNAGNVTLQTNQLFIQGGAQIGVTTFGQGKAGILDVSATDIVKIVGNGSGMFASTLGQGEGGTLTLTTGSLWIRQQGAISTSTSNQGNAGDLTIRAEEIDLSDTSNDASESSSIRAQANNGSTGNGGNLTIETGRLVLQEGAKVSTSAQGEGKGGNLTINATESIKVIGRSLNGRTTPSGIFARTEGRTEQAGDGGDLTITTKRFVVRDGGQVSASTFSRGNAGNLTIQASEFVEVVEMAANGFPGGIFAQVNARATGNGGNFTINTSQLRIQNGGTVAASTSGEGRAGTLWLNARELIEVSGVSSVFSVPSLLTVQTNRQSTGDGGNLIVTTGQLTVRDQAQIGVDSLGSGKAGTLDITTDSVLLDNKGILTARTISDNGGDINLKVSDLLLLRRGGGISTTAGLEGTGGDGGNININTQFLVAIPKEDSDITANAFIGKGGNIQINANAIFGTQFSLAPTLNSEITASSTFGISGLVTINSPDTSFIQNNLNQLAQNPIDTNALLTNSCIARNQQNGTFYITGREGLPTNPGELSVYSTGAVQATHWKRGDPIVEPQGVYQLPNGQLLMSRECE